MQRPRRLRSSGLSARSGRPGGERGAARLGPGDPAVRRIDDHRRAAVGERPLPPDDAAGADAFSRRLRGIHLRDFRVGQPPPLTVALGPLERRRRAVIPEPLQVGISPGGARRGLGQTGRRQQQHCDGCGGPACGVRRKHPSSVDPTADRRPRGGERFPPVGTVADVRLGSSRLAGHRRPAIRGEGSMMNYQSILRRGPMAFALVALAMAVACGGAEMPADEEAMAEPMGSADLVQRILPNPTSEVLTSWVDLPEGRTWGSTAGVDIDPTDGHVWVYDRCGANGLDGGCAQNPDVDPILKYDRKHRRADGRLRSGTPGPAARPARRRRRQRLGDRLAGQRRDRAPGVQVQSGGRGVDDARRCRASQAATRRGVT